LVLRFFVLSPFSFLHLTKPWIQALTRKTPRSKL
jgi:hypothetical protein